MMGQVFLVGAGPGDGGLMTLRGRELLERADVVVYDALVGTEALAMIPPDARCVNVGKRAGRHTMGQEEIDRLLLEEAQAGHTVVRLKGGDPFLFGRGGEELELLAAHGVPFQVVPGITSAISVPAYCGIPVTHRDYSASVHIITAHRRQGTELDLDYEALVRAGGTLVFLMGTGALPALCRGLMEAGMSPDMPAAVLQQGTTAGQRRVVSTLAALPEAARDPRPPAVIVVGEVCRLSEPFAWAERRPLFGKRFLVTRPRRRAGALTARLRELGAEVVELPTIDLRPLPAADLNGLAESRWLVLTSPSGAEIFCDLLRDRGMDARRLAHLKIAALGPGTAGALARRGLLADLVPETYDAASLGRALAPRLRPGDRVFLARAREADPILPELLGQVPGVEVREEAIYETALIRHPVLEPLALLDERTWAVFTSASTVRGFAAAAGTKDLTAVRALCVGRQTQAQALAYGMTTYVAGEATVDGLIDLALTLDKEEP